MLDGISGEGNVSQTKIGIVIPMANESNTFTVFAQKLIEGISTFEDPLVLFVVDNSSRDNTRQLCEKLSCEDRRFVTVWEPSSQCVVHARLAGCRQALEKGCGIIINMDAGLSHEPAVLQNFVDAIQQGHECAFGSRRVHQGSYGNVPVYRQWVSKTGTLLANRLLGTHFTDMTSGYLGFASDVVKNLTDCRIRSRAYFFETEIRYLLRHRKWVEIPIRYKSSSSAFSIGEIEKSLGLLIFYFLRRLSCRSDHL